MTNMSDFFYSHLAIQHTNYPKKTDFSLVEDSDFGKGIKTLKYFSSHSLLAYFQGQVIHYVTQHSVQINSYVHLLDEFFVGFLLHSCDPNAQLDMERFALWAVKDIKPGEYITIDYQATEEVLYRQFACHCGAENCRKWITGFKEQSNVEGLKT